MKPISSDPIITSEKTLIHLRQKSSSLPLTSSMEIQSSSDKTSLINHKIFLKKLLNIIKICQIDFLSNKKKFNKKSSNKSLLSTLKTELFNILKESTFIKASIQNEIITKKKILQKQVFGEESNISDNNNNNLNDNYLLGSENIIDLNYSNDQKNKTNIKPKSLKKAQLIEQAENNLYYNIHIELYHLKLLNFKIENQIEALNSNINQRTYIINCAKTFSFDSEYIPRIYCNTKAEIDKAYKILYNINNHVLKAFREVVKAKNKIEADTNEIKARIDNIEICYYNYFNQGTKKYIETKDIIDEESREYTKSIAFTVKNTNNINNNDSKRGSINNIININKINNIININLN